MARKAISKPSAAGKTRAAAAGGRASSGRPSAGSSRGSRASSGSSSRGSSSRGSKTGSRGRSSAPSAGLVSSARRGIKEAAEGARRGLADAADSTKRTLRRAGASLSELPELNVGGRTINLPTALLVLGGLGLLRVASRGELGNKLSGSASSMAQGASKLSNSLMEGIRDLGENQPLALGLGALVLGGLVATGIPVTERENQLMGEWRDSLVEQAQTKVGELKQTVQQLAGSVSNLASGAASSVSNTASDLAEGASDLAGQGKRQRGRAVGKVKRSISGRRRG